MSASPDYYESTGTIHLKIEGQKAEAKAKKQKLKAKKKEEEEEKKEGSIWIAGRCLERLDGLLYS